MRWQVTVDWQPGTGSERVRERRVDSVSELRALVVAARTNPNITRCRYVPLKELVGEPPTECRRGHDYAGGSFTAVRLDWSVCACGGHVVYRCRWPGCGDVLLDPEPAVDCLPSAGTMITTRSTPEGNDGSP
ncbi:hypothetical protein JNW90_01025 [Micromonospora sp. STR1s_5]|nr:hypothetical protein [Micromonospora sp. STR1s_5]